MDFAKKHLEKYGWTAGKGLGRHEDGIREALKPQLKRSTAGVGHDAAKDFTDHWWNKLYDKASGNIQVETTKNGKTKKITVKDPDAVELTNKTWSVKKKKKANGDPVTENHGYVEHFVRKAILTSGGAITTRLDDDKSENSCSDDDDMKAVTDVKKSILQMTDEELFAACGGRTAHKGARHGLRATGKLARVQEQEALLLKEARFNGYSHKKLNDNNITGKAEKKEKKRKKTIEIYENKDTNVENCEQNGIQSESNGISKSESYAKELKNTEISRINESHCESISEGEKKSKKKKRKLGKEVEKTGNEEIREQNEIQLNNIEIVEQYNSDLVVGNKEKESKKKKRKLQKEMEKVDEENRMNLNDIKITKESIGDLIVDNRDKVSKKKKRKLKEIAENTTEGIPKHDAEVLIKKKKSKNSGNESKVLEVENTGLVSNCKDLKEKKRKKKKQ